MMQQCWFDPQDACVPCCVGPCEVLIESGGSICDTAVSINAGLQRPAPVLLPYSNIKESVRAQLPYSDCGGPAAGYDWAGYCEQLLSMYVPWRMQSFLRPIEMYACTCCRHRMLHGRLKPRQE